MHHQNKARTQIEGQTILLRACRIGRSMISHPKTYEAGDAWLKLAERRLKKLGLCNFQEDIKKIREWSTWKKEKK